MMNLYDDETIMRNHDNRIKREAREKEREKGICAVVNTVRALSQNRDAAIQMIMDQFGLQKQTATDKVAQYWA